MTGHLLNGDAQQIAQQAMGEVSAASPPSWLERGLSWVQDLANVKWLVSGALACAGGIWGGATWVSNTDHRLETLEKTVVRVEQTVNETGQDVRAMSRAVQEVLIRQTSITGSLPIVAPPEAEKASKPDVKVSKVRTRDIKPAAPSPWAWMTQGKAP